MYKLSECVEMWCSLTILQMSVQHNSIRQIRRTLWPHDMPIIVMYGDSHITHLEAWMGIHVLAKVKGKPTSMDRKAMSNAYYCAVGGLRFDTVHKRVQGIEVPEHQVKCGNQWQHITKKLKLDPNATVVSCGGNDCSRFDGKVKRRLQNVNGDTVELETKMVSDEFKVVKKEIDKVFGRLKSAFEHARIVFVGVWYRPGWHSATKKLADEINSYIDAEVAHKVVYMGRFLGASSFMSDDVHLTHEGYRVFMDQVITSCVNAHLQNTLTEEKRFRRYCDQIAQERA